MMKSAFRSRSFTWAGLPGTLQQHSLCRSPGTQISRARLGVSKSTLTSAEFGAFRALAEVFAGHFDGDTHFSQTRSHPVADTVAECVFVFCGLFPILVG